jgi:putative intracellular protease/amidase
MHPVYAAANAMFNVALSDLLEVLATLDDEAVGWAPTPAVNTVAVLVRHAITATAFLAGTAAGLAPDRERYRSEERAAAFAASGVPVATLCDEVLALRNTRLPAILDHGTDATLAALAPWAMDTRHWSGAELLIHAFGHLREHTGHAGLTRDLWLARKQ